MDNTFVGKDFYVEPPKKSTSVDEWNNWLKKDNQKRAAAKASHTRKQQPVEPVFQQVTRKVNGVWRSQTPIGFSGSEEHGFQVEPVQHADQERKLVASRWEKRKRGTKGKSSHARKKSRRKSQQRDQIKTWKPRKTGI